jgi:aryl-alcohol dehydrogenase-like predicted oxidoreductase
MEDLVPRSDLVVATKAGSVPDPDRRFDTSRGHLLSALDASLQRLGTDYVDLWQVHAFDPGTPMEETLQALDIAVSSGRARYVGVSNFCGWQLAKAAAWQLAGPGRTPLASTQMEYSLLQRGVEREVLPAAVDLGVGLLPSSPLGRGVLTGKYRHGTPPDSRGGSEDLAAFVAPYLDETARLIVDALAIAADGLAVSPLHVALAWVRDRPGVTAPLIGARNAAQLTAALSVEALTLPEEINLALDDVSAPLHRYPDHDWSTL